MLKPAIWKPVREALLTSPNFDGFISRIAFLARLQRWLIDLGNRRSAIKWLMGLAFLESIIFPLPIDPIYGALVMARPKSYLRLTLLTAGLSTLGGAAGWLIGLWLGDAASGWLGDSHAYHTIAAGFVAYGWIFVLIGAFTPLPYKIMALSAGFLGLGFLPFITASLIGRGARFALVGAIVKHRNDSRKALFFTSVLLGLFILFWWLLP